MRNTVLITFVSFALICCNPAPNSIESQSNAGTKAAYGIDISEYQGGLIDFLNNKTDSLDFIICKATEGVTIQDTAFNSNWNLIKSKGFIPGCYHFYHCQDNITLQADNYLNAVKSFASDDMPPIVDFEENSVSANCTTADIQTGLLNFLDTLMKRTGRKPIVYTNPNTADMYLKDSRFSNYALWVADPTEAKNPLVPSVWKSNGWTIWQKSWKYAAVVKDTSDFDVFNGDRDSLKKFIETY